MKFSFVGISRLTLEHTPGAKQSKHVATDVRLDVDKQVDCSAYLDKDGLPTKEGSRILSLTLTHGIIAMIHQSHQLGFRDSAEHLRAVIAEMERGFVEIATIKPGTMDDTPNIY